MEGIKYSKEDLQTLQVSITNTSTSTKTINLFDGTGLYNANETNSSNQKNSTKYTSMGGRVQGVFNPVDGLYYTFDNSNSKLIAYNSDGVSIILKEGISGGRNLTISVASQRIYYINASNEFMRYTISNGNLDNFGSLSGYTNVSSIFVSDKLSLVMYCSQIDEIIYFLDNNESLDLLNALTPLTIPVGGLSILSNPNDNTITSETYVTYIDNSGFLVGFNYLQSSTTQQKLLSVTFNEGLFQYYPTMNYMLYPDLNKMLIVSKTNSGLNVDSISSLNNSSSLAVRTIDNSVVMNTTIPNSFYILSESDLISKKPPILTNTGISDDFDFVGIVGNEQSIISNNRNNFDVVISKEAGGLIFSNPDAYNFLVWNIKNEPIKVFDIDLVTSTFNQLTKIISVNRVDANGVSFIEPYIPINDFSAYQQQTLKVSIPFINLVLDGNTYFKDYEILSGETVNFILWYIQETKNLYDESSMIVMIKNPLSKDIIKQM